MNLQQTLLMKFGTWQSLKCLIFICNCYRIQTVIVKPNKMSFDFRFVYTIREPVRTVK